MNANATAQIRAVACLDLARALRSAQGKINKHRKAWIEAENEAIFLVCGRQLTQWRGDDGKPLCKTCKRAARKPEASARRSNAADEAIRR